MFQLWGGVRFAKEFFEGIPVSFEDASLTMEDYHAKLHDELVQERLSEYFGVLKLPKNHSDRIFNSK